MANTKIIIRLEKEVNESQGETYEFEMTEPMVCALFDLQYMLTEEVLETVELNHMTKPLNAFWELINKLDTKMHGHTKRKWKNINISNSQK